MDSPPTFFIDRSLGRRQVADALRKAGFAVEIHDDHFDQAAEDSLWLTETARRGWLILTKDKNIGYRPLELLAVKNSGARVYCLVSQNMAGRAMACAFVEAAPRIVDHAQRAAPPFIAKVYRDGSVEDWKNSGDL